MYRYSMMYQLLLSVVLMFGVTTVFAADPEPMGKISIEAKSLSVGLGFEWGEGTLTLNDGRVHKFSIDGLKLVGVGFQKVSSVGNVYHLTSVADFPGTYTAAEATITLAGGGGGVTMKNQNGVHITLSSTTKGMGLTLGAKGVTIKWGE